MKKILTILIILFAYSAQSQILQEPTIYGTLYRNLGSKEGQLIPTFCGAPTLPPKLLNYGQSAIAFDSCNHIFYVYDPVTKTWSPISGSAVIQDGLISGGIVSWVSGLTFNVSASIFRKFGVLYYTRDTTITLDSADANYNRIDRFALDTTNGGEVIKITGIPSPIPIEPQVLDYQISLTTGINLNVGETTPDNVSTQIIYRENIEWSTSASGEGTADFNNTTFPFQGSKDILVSSYGNIERLQFTRSGTGTMNGSEVLKMHIALKDTLKSGRTIRVLFLNNNTPLSSNIVPITKNYGLDPNKVGQYQTIQMPASYFQFTSNDYNRMIIYATGYDTTGTGGFYIDDIELQSGINNVPPPTTSSNKVDSVTIKKMTINGDTAHIAYNWINGIAYPKKDTIWTQTQDTSVHLSLTGIHPIFFEQITKDSANIRFRTDSLPALSYPALRDTTDWTNNTLIDKQYFSDRISTVTTTGITRAELQDTAAAIRNDFPTGSVGVLSVTGNPSNLVNNTDPANPVIQQDASKLDKSDSTIANRVTANTSNISTNTTNIASNTTAIAGKQNALTLTTTGTSGAATLTGATLNIPQYSGGGGSALDKQDSMNIYMPEKYGAVGDGVTDDAAAFTAMIAAMPARGGHVNLMSKTYKINSTITVNKSIWFEGNGMADSIQAGGNNKITKIIGGTDNMVLFRIVENHVSFSNMAISSTSGSTISGCAIRIDSNLRTHSHVAGFDFDKVAFNGFYNIIEATGAYDGKIQDCHIEFYANYGIWIANNIVPDAGDSYITGCLFVPKNATSFAGIYQTSSGGLRILNNKFNYNSSTRGKYAYYGDITGSGDLIINANSFENYTVSAIKLKGPSTYFPNATINGNQFSGLVSGSRPDITIDSCVSISIQGNTFYKEGNDTAILLTNTQSTNISNTYYAYGVPVYYAGTNSNLQGDGGAKYTAYVYDSKGVQRTTSVIKDSVGIVSLGLKSSGLPTNYITSSTGNGQLSFLSNYNTAGGLDASIINSNTSGGGITFWQQTGASTAQMLLRAKNNGYIGILTPNPVTPLNITSTTEPLRLSYDASHYGNFTVASDGTMTINSSNNQIRINQLGINTSTPNQVLDVNGAAMMGGVRKTGTITGLASSGKLLVNWDANSSGAGSVDLFANRGAGSQGGFKFYDYDNSNVSTYLMGLSNTGVLTPQSTLQLVPGTTTVLPLQFTSGVSNTTPKAGAFEYTTPQLFFTNGDLIRQEIPQIQQLRISTQFDQASQTVPQISPLKATVKAGSTYRFEAVLYTTSNSAAGVKVTIGTWGGSGISSANIIYETLIYDNGTVAAQRRATDLTTSTGVTAVSNACIKINGTITVNSSGGSNQILLEFSQNASNATASSMLVGSTLVVTQIN